MPVLNGPALRSGSLSPKPKLVELSSGECAVLKRLRAEQEPEGTEGADEPLS